MAPWMWIALAIVMTCATGVIAIVIVEERRKRRDKAEGAALIEYDAQWREHYKPEHVSAEALREHPLLKYLPPADDTPRAPVDLASIRKTKQRAARTWVPPMRLPPGDDDAA